MGRAGCGRLDPWRGQARPVAGSLLFGLVLAATLGGSSAAQDHSRHAAHLRDGAPPAGDERETALSIPDVQVTTQDGQEVRFYQDLVKDRVVAMNFIFTTCTTICPPMGAIFSRLQDRLGDAAGRDVHLVSVSVDPVVDTPQRLKEWGARFDAGPGWTLVTGSKAEVDRLLKSLQIFTPDFEDHSPTVLVGNDGVGEWQRTYGLAPPAKLHDLLEEMRLAGDASPH